MLCVLKQIRDKLGRNSNEQFAGQCQPNELFAKQSHSNELFAGRGGARWCRVEILANVYDGGVITRNGDNDDCAMAQGNLRLRKDGRELSKSTI